jgi:microcystin-dependent protein
MSEPFMGNVMLVAFNFAPRGWAFCNGQLLPINQNQALFSLLGTIYGGNGTTTFALPDLRSRVPVGGTGQGPGLTNIVQGERGGAESVTVLAANISGHTHPLNVQSSAGTTSVPGTGTVLAQTVVDDGTPVSSYSSTAPNTALAAASISTTTGGSTPVGIRNPYLGLQYIIALQGIFPSRN